MMNCNFYIINPNSGGGGSTPDTFATTFQTNSTVRFPQFLRTTDGAYSNRSPYPLGTNALLTNISIYTGIAEQDQFDIQLRVNNIAVLTFTKPSGTDSISIATSYSLSTGDRISARIQNLADDIEVPGCTLTFTAV